MEDRQIIDLYWKRNENAINESNIKYGAYCTTIANNILQSKNDSEECVNDTWYHDWNAIPPEIPQKLSLFFGRITRNLAIDRFRKNRSKKAGGGQFEICLDELSECIGDNNHFEERIILKDLLNDFLRNIPQKNREIFMMRYWYMMSVHNIAERQGISEGSVKMILQRLRNKLKVHLEREGITI